MKESQSIEYKEIWKDEYLKWIAGFANASGGKLYIGINDAGEVIGAKNDNKLLEDIPNKIVSILGIIPEVHLLEKENKKYIEVIIYPSRPYNKTIAEIFFKTGFIEAWGRGISKIITGFELAKLPVPEFKNTMGGILVSIYRKKNNANEGVSEGVSEGVNEGVNELFDLIKSHPGKRTPFLAEKLTTSVKNIERWIQILKKTDKIEFIGSSKKGGYYAK